mgnify:FL=1
MIEALNLESSAIEGAVWDDGELLITFQDGRQHTYFGVPQRVFEELIDAGSVGAYFNAYVRDRYSGRAD